VRGPDGTVAKAVIAMNVSDRPMKAAMCETGGMDCVPSISRTVAPHSTVLFPIDPQSRSIALECSGVSVAAAVDFLTGTGSVRMFESESEIKYLSGPEPLR
jgi:hypothetical protein